MSTTLTVRGMTCGHCEQTVEDALNDIDGVRDAEADRDAEQVVVDGEADPAELIAAVEDTGYEASA